MALQFKRIARKPVAHRTRKVTFNYKVDSPPGKDPDSHSPLHKADHQLLWTKELCDGELFKVQVPAGQRSVVRTT